MRLLKKWGGKRIESHAVAVGQRFERYFRCASKTRKGFCHTIPPPVDAANHFQTIGGRISNLGASEHYIPEWIQFFPRNQKYSSNPKSDNKWSGRPDRWCQLTFCSVLIPNHHPSRKSRALFSVILWNNQDLLVKQEEVPRTEIGNWDCHSNWRRQQKRRRRRRRLKNKIEKKFETDWNLLLIGFWFICHCKIQYMPKPNSIFFTRWFSFNRVRIRIRSKTILVHNFDFDSKENR